MDDDDALKFIDLLSFLLAAAGDRRGPNRLKDGQDVACEFLVQVRRNAGFEARGFPVVIAFDDLRH